MKSLTAFALSLTLGCLVGCGSSPPPSASTPAAPTAPAPEAKAADAAESAPAPAEEGPQKSAAEAWAEKKSRAEEASNAPSSTDSVGADPLAIGGALESSSTTKIELTPARELRNKSARDLQDGFKLVEKAATYEEAAQKLGVRLGKPTWIESGKKRVWVVRDGAKCYRLVLEPDGAVETETAQMNEWRMLSALSQQNVCTGAVQNGVPGMKAN